MKHRNDGVGMDKRIWCVETVKERAEETAAHLRAMGNSARVMKRLIRADGCETVGYVVITDRQFPAHGSAPTKGERP